MHRWESCYILVREPIYDASFDWVISECADPLASSLRERGLVSGHFFVRFLERFPHLRLRLRLQNGLESVKGEVEEFLGHMADTRYIGCTWTPYEPETERYGGEHAIGASEEFFIASSEAVGALLPQLSRRPRSYRLGIAAALMLQTCRTFASPDCAIADLCNHFSLSYFGVEDRERINAAAHTSARTGASSMERVIEALMADYLCLGEPFDTFAESARKLAHQCSLLCAEGRLHYEEQWLLPTWSVLSSNMHMTNNRLGITRDEECYLARMLAIRTGFGTIATA